MNQWVSFLIAVIAVVAMVAAIDPFLRWVGRLFSISPIYFPSFVSHCRNSLRFLVVVVAAKVLLSHFVSPGQSWEANAQHISTIALIGAIAWFVADVVGALEDVLEKRINATYLADDVRNRRAMTQILLLKQFVTAMIVVVAAGAILMTFPEVRALGTGLLASAGIISIVAGLAAQSSLTNLFAGLQLALSNELRVGDIVSIDDKSGVVDEITLTYVVVQLWEDRSLILPSSYFISQPFENWTRSLNKIAGSFFVDVDWTADVERIRQEFLKVVERSPLWDQREAHLNVVDLVNGQVRLRMYVTAEDTGSLFNLQWQIREALVKFIVDTNLDWLPRSRFEGQR